MKETMYKIHITEIVSSQQRVKHFLKCDDALKAAEAFVQMVNTIEDRGTQYVGVIWDCTTKDPSPLLLSSSEKALSRLSPAGGVN